ncbi:MAG TPA: hypothetical protein VK900_12650 [Anaerolineales bacterium]|nr:hypothetical protein [Anaerolineales bacterium]
MDHFSLEVMGKQKLKGLREEGMRNQARHMPGTRTTGQRTTLLRLALTILGILGTLQWLVY